MTYGKHRTTTFTSVGVLCARMVGGGNLRRYSELVNWFIDPASDADGSRRLRQGRDVYTCSLILIIPSEISEWIVSFKRDNIPL